MKPRFKFLYRRGGTYFWESRSLVVTCPVSFFWRTP